MPKISFAGLKNPGTRARWIIWLGAAVLGLAAVVIVALGATSGYWFCANGCHKVQDDTITAYNHSPHNKISCMACHMPVNANPAIFLLHKAEALGELYMTVRNDYELPLNRFSAVSLEMSDKQCTQCHNLDTRDVTPAPGIKIDHQKHIEEGIACTVCHNRVAHVEDFEFKNKDPKTGELNRAHQDFMSMTACFRCHTQDEVEAKVVGVANEAKAEGEAAEGEAAAGEATEGEATEGEGAAEGEGEEKITAPGACEACHPKDFDLKPAYHKEKGFFPAGHAERAKEVVTEVAEADELRSEFEAEAAAGHGGEEPVGMKIPFAGQVNECKTCHKSSFCDSCHGMEIPHPAEFKEPEKSDDASGHPAVSKKLPKKCVMCHTKKNPNFCNECHHGTAIKYELKDKPKWVNQHPKAVEESGLNSCFEKCHEKKFCVDCHTKRRVVPASHEPGSWLHKDRTVTVYGQQAAKPSATHALSAQKSIESCEICHGSGGPNAKFCRNCHEHKMPHPDEFKKFHAKTGRQNKSSCSRCHQFREVCSNCHHVGSSFTASWIGKHGAAATKNDPASCTEKCHDKKFCVSCHNREDPLPRSHRASRFVRDKSAKTANHAQLYQKDSQICTYCHGSGGTDAKFCKSCHKIAMPHKIDEGSDQKFGHADSIKKKRVARKTCLNCHSQFFCDSCHHEGARAGKPWLRYHPNVVRKGGQSKVNDCYKCHKQGEVFCSTCHVNLAKRGLI
ncbi:MAG: NapC/NirT family cytochrome c [Coriobacteriales bacterium]|nr:NapC/NirT family cytochrome c [Coriobacteriales bacterium]